MATSELQINAASRLQVILERVKQSAANTVQDDLRSIGDKITTLLISNGELSELTKSQLDRVISQSELLISNYLSTKYTGITDDLVKSVIDRAIEVEVNTLNEVIKTGNFEAKSVSVDDAYSNYQDTPMTDGSANGAVLAGMLIASLVSKESERIGNAIRGSYFNGLANQDAISAVVGKRNQRFANSALSQVSRNSVSIMKTVTQHGANIARTSTMTASGINKYRWVATLDTKTSSQCRTLDEIGAIYVVGKGPMPPLHINCRSTIIAVIDNRRGIDREESTRSARGPSGKSERVDGSLGYYEWLKIQPASFQNMAIGPTRGKLLRDGGLSADKFAKLNLNRNFQPLSLDDMRLIDPQAFVKAGV